MAYLGKWLVLDDDDRTGDPWADISTTLDLNEYTLDADDDLWIQLEIGSAAKPLAADGSVTIDIYRNDAWMGQTVLQIPETLIAPQTGMEIRGCAAGDEIKLSVISTDTNAAEVAVRSRICSATRESA